MRIEWIKQPVRNTFIGGLIVLFPLKSVVDFPLFNRCAVVINRAEIVLSRNVLPAPLELQCQVDRYKIIGFFKIG